MADALAEINAKLGKDLLAYGDHNPIAQLDGLGMEYLTGLCDRYRMVLDRQKKTKANMAQALLVHVDPEANQPIEVPGLGRVVSVEIWMSKDGSEDKKKLKAYWKAAISRRNNGVNSTTTTPATTATRSTATASTSSGGDSGGLRDAVVARLRIGSAAAVPLPAEPVAVSPQPAASASTTTTTTTTSSGRGAAALQGLELANKMVAIGDVTAKTNITKKLSVGVNTANAILELIGEGIKVKSADIADTLFPLRATIAAKGKELLAAQ